ncbi:MAG TPA: HEAT repeat domain-containing protein [Polyangiaceae bacterium]|nr:HEAT repeat domain-containing protein [Polyangiaceae bacterium]
MFGRAPRSFDAALRDLSAKRADVRASAAEELAPHAENHRTEVVDALRHALDDSAAEVRAAAALALADAGADEAVPTLIEAIADEDDHVQQMAITALGELRASAAAEAIRGALSHEAAPVRFQAVIAYPRVATDHEDAVRALVEATRDEDALVRHIALRMAEELGTPHTQDTENEGTKADDTPIAAPLLTRARALLRDDSDVVRIAAAVVLARAGLRDGTDILIGVANRELVTSEADDEAAALDLCGELALKEATPGLVERGYSGGLLTSRNAFAWQARVALAALGYERAQKWVLAELKAWTRERRTLGVAAVIQSKLAAARPLLEAMRGDPTRADPELVAEALATLDANER